MSKTSRENDIHPMPFHTLSDNEFATMNQSFGNELSQDDMDRLNQLKFNPFESNDNIALNENNTNLDNTLQINKISCNYYSPNELRGEIAEMTNQNQFSILHLNIRSIANKFDYFKELLNSLDTTFKVIGLTETWLNDYNDDSFKLPKYEYIGSNRTNKKGGGVGIYVSKQLQYNIRKDLKTDIEDIIETIFIEISIFTGKNIIVGVIYSHQIIKWKYFKMLSMR
jgi:hypothetical protein